MRLTDIVSRAAVVAPMAAVQRDDAIRELVAALVRASAVAAPEADALVASVLKREEKGSTGFGKGVAVPHVKHPTLPRMVAALGVSDRGVDFRALDQQPVYSIILLLSPERDPEAIAQRESAIEYLPAALSGEALDALLA